MLHGTITVTQIFVEGSDINMVQVVHRCTGNRSNRGYTGPKPPRGTVYLTKGRSYPYIQDLERDLRVAGCVSTEIKHK